MIARVVIPALAACGGAPSIASHAIASDRCAMVEAALQLDQLKKFACGEAATRDHRILVDVDMTPRFAETCSSNVFAIYQSAEPTNTNAVLRLSIGSRDGQKWTFSAAFFDPPNSPDDAETADGGFDTANYYCAFAGGRLVRSKHGWRSWFDPGS